MTYAPTNLNRALLQTSSGAVVIVNDDRRLSVEQMQQWVDTMNQYLISKGTDKVARYYLG
jgi:hypothetical protein